MSIAFVMPVYNEESTIENFISEIMVVFCEYEKLIYIVDDCSTDNTRALVRELKKNSPGEIILIENNLNIGHGNSTIRGWHVALSSGFDTIVCFDGDGEFNLIDLKVGLRKHLAGRYEISEGLRVERFDPAYRALVTFGVKVMVILRTGHWILDTNTPIRIYNRDALIRISKSLEYGSNLPNIVTSILTRRGNFYFTDFRIRSQRRKESVVGSTWDAKFTRMPSKKFLKFIFSAVRELNDFLSNPRSPS
jgi:glycosyltransferase involved in cell wall biosynthesis